MTQENSQVSPEQAYFDDLMKKFNKDPESEDLTAAERVLAAKISVIQKDISEVVGELEKINKEVSEKQEKGVQLAQKLTHLQGRAQGLVDSLLALK